MICTRVYRLNKACVEFERNLDKFLASQENGRSAHPVLWIFIGFYTVRLKNGWGNMEIPFSEPTLEGFVGWTDPRPRVQLPWKWMLRMRLTRSLNARTAKPCTLRAFRQGTDSLAGMHNCLQQEVKTANLLVNVPLRTCRAWKPLRRRVLLFVVVVNKFVYKLVVIVNGHGFVDKTGFLHNVNGLRSREPAGQGLFLSCRKLGQIFGETVNGRVLHIRSCGYPICFPQEAAGTVLQGQDADLVAQRSYACKTCRFDTTSRQNFFFESHGRFTNRICIQR